MRISLFCVLLLVSSCLNSGQIENEAISEKEDQVDLQHIKEVALSFHQWNIESILDEDHSIDIDFTIVEGPNGKCKIDSTSYFKNLRSLGTISEKFIQSEWNRVQKCSTFLESLEWETFVQSEAYEYQDYCDFYYYFWTRTQEPFHGVEVKDVKKVDDHYLVTLSFFFEYEKREYVDSQIPIIKIENEKGGWKITEITWKK